MNQIITVCGGKLTCFLTGKCADGSSGSEPNGLIIVYMLAGGTYYEERDCKTKGDLDASAAPHGSVINAINISPKLLPNSSDLTTPSSWKEVHSVRLCKANVE